ncbi:hypothetical protein THAOC_19488, partial [Thalassiosira oceanica]
MKKQGVKDDLSTADGNEVYKFARFPYGFSYYYTNQDYSGVVRPDKCYDGEFGECKGHKYEYMYRTLPDGFPGELTYQHWANATLWELDNSGGCYAQLVDDSNDFGTKV